MIFHSLSAWGSFVNVGAFATSKSGMSTIANATTVLRLRYEHVLTFLALEALSLEPLRKGSAAADPVLFICLLWGAVSQAEAWIAASEFQQIEFE